MKQSLFIITGSSSGIGHSICKNLVQHRSNKVIGLARNNSLDAENYQFVSLDLSKIENVKNFEIPNLEGYQKVVLINNAGMLGEVNTLDRIDLEQIEQIMAVNYTAAMILATKFIQKTQDMDISKVIINISSGAATGAYASWANYCASKAALEMLTKCINVEQQNQTFPIRCYAIAPGVVDTNMQKQIRNTDIESFEMKPKFEDLHKNNELYNPDTVAENIIEVALNPLDFQETIFRVKI